VGVLAFGPSESSGRRPGRCPGLSIDSGGVAHCGVFENAGGRFNLVWRLLGASGRAARARVLGFGVGCCIRARVLARGVVLNFATLPDKTKLEIVKSHCKTD